MTHGGAGTRPGACLDLVTNPLANAKGPLPRKQPRSSERGFKFHPISCAAESATPDQGHLYGSL
jgi:hypothetical protein